MRATRSSTKLNQAPPHTLGAASPSGVYRAELRRLQKEYGVRTVLLATDDADGSVMKELRCEPSG